MNDAVLDYLERERTAILQRFMDLVRIPSVSTDPSYEKGMEQARGVLLERLRSMGLTRVRTIAAGGHPAAAIGWTREIGRLC